LEQVPPTRKLFWFRPPIHPDARDPSSCTHNTSGSSAKNNQQGRESFRVVCKDQLSTISRATLQWREAKRLPTIPDDESGNTEEDEVLVGLGFLEEEE
jgi:hypothetical protein